MAADDPEELAQTVLVAGGTYGAGVAIRLGYLQLVVMGDGAFASYPLPDAGTFTLGRGSRCDLPIDHDSISRRHATLTIGDTLSIEDLGSANGTVVRGQRLAPHQPATIAVGEIVGLGSTNIILQQRSRAAGTQRLWTAATFRARVEDECDSSVELAWLRVHPDPGAPPGVIEDTLRTAVRAADLVGKIGAVFEILLVDTPAGQAEETLARIERTLRERGVRARLAIACFPRDGRTPDALAHRLDAPTRAAAGAAADVVVASPQMRDLHRLVTQVAVGNLGVLLLGETGVGKEVFAHALHRASPRAAGPFVELHCGALTEALLESELFGHEKGAFTHAHAAKPGLIELAHAGTLLLDEIGDMPLDTQVKLLRVIENGQLRRVGGVTPRTIDVRFVAATNRDLEAQVARGMFRRDLFYRLNGVTIEIPPLRERLDELEPLARAFVARAWTRGGPPPALAPDALALLRAYAWPGNLRELKHVLERAVLLCEAGPITVAHLPADRLRASVPPEARTRVPDLHAPVPLALPRKGSPEEQQRIVDALARAGGNQTVAARLLGISRRTLVNRLDEYQLDRPRKPTRRD